MAPPPTTKSDPKLLAHNTARVSNCLTFCVVLCAKVDTWLVDSTSDEQTSVLFLIVTDLVLTRFSDELEPLPTVTVSLSLSLPVLYVSVSLRLLITVQMIREIATFSDVHHRDNADYSSVQTIMEAFFQSVAEPPRAGAPPQAVNFLLTATQLSGPRSSTNSARL